MKPSNTSAVRFLFLIILTLLIGRANASITVNIQPGNQTVGVGQTATFGAVVVTTGGEVITGYQWFSSPNNTGPFATVGTAASLVISNADLVNAGYYYVIVTYQTGVTKQTVMSPQATLTVDPKPRIITQPVDVTSPPGSNAVFSATAGGEAPLTYQWRFNGTYLFDNSRITGTSGTTLQISNLVAGDAGNYDLIVANSYGMVTSQVANLTVGWIPPAITSSTNTTGQQGHAVNYAITAVGTPPMTFGANGLPADMVVDPVSGAFTGIPQLSGVFNVTLYATNGGYTITTNLVLTLSDDIPGITSSTNASGRQGYFFSYTITATNDPAWFDAGPLPLGLSVNNTNGVISGIPLVSNTFLITIDTTNAYGSATQTLSLSLQSGAALITSPLTKSGKQGQAFSYTIRATNNPATYSAAPLPAGLNIDPNTGIISGIPLVNGTYPVTIGSANEFGSDSETLTLTLSGGAPVITSALTTTGQEDGNFGYIIKANNGPTSFWATNLPMGLSINPSNGVISGVPIYAGNYDVPISAANAWGVGSATLQLNINNLQVGGLFITNVMTNYFSPYLLEFTFQLRDGADPLTSHAVVASPSLMSVQAFEDSTLVDPTETGVYLKPAASKVLKGYLVLDFTASIASLDNGDTNNNGISDAVDAEIAGAISFVNEQPAGSQIGVIEFHRDDEAPQQVIPLTSDKTLLNNAIAGIWTNYVQGFPAGSRAWDALGMAVTALGSATNNENHYVVFMSDGGDDSSTNTLANVTNLATTNNVQIFTVGYGDEVDQTTLGSISAATSASYYPSADPTALALNFAIIGKDLSSQYILRWATLKRSSTAFMPSFQISYQGQIAQSPPVPQGIISGTNYTYTTNISTGDITTNTVFLYTTNYIISPFKPTVYAGNVLAGALSLVPNAATNPTAIHLRATYVPRYIQELHLHYSANYPVTASLDTTNADNILDGWTMMQTNDGAGGEWVTLSSPDPTNPTNSIPFADFGNLLTFSFGDPITASNAFSSFYVDNTIYTNTSGTNFYGFLLTNAVSSINSNLPPPPPHGTPIPWLISHGFTNNFAAAELINTNGNGLAIWQDYLAGLNPLDTNDTFIVQVEPGQNPPQITFNTVVGRNYRIEWSLGLNGPWTVLRDGFVGTGGDMTYTDVRNLSSIISMFYRVAAEGPPPAP